MKIEFDYLEFSNFKGFSGQHIFPLKTYGPGLHFLCGRNEIEPRLGSNGSGKSSLWDALTWCLFGKTLSGLRNPDVKPRVGKGPTWVTLDFRLDGKQHELCRTIKPNTLLLDSKEVGQEQVGTLLGLNIDVFGHTVLLGQSQPLFFDLQPKAKMELFTAVLNLERWEQRAYAANDKYASLMGTHIKLESEQKAVERGVEEIAVTIEDITAKSADWVTNQRTKTKACTADYKTHVNMLDKALDQQDKIRTAGANANKVYETLQDKLRVIDEQLAKKRSERDKLRGTYGLLGQQLEDMVKKSDGGTCPTCGQEIKGEDLGVHISELTLELNELRKKRKEVEKVTEALERERDAMYTDSRTVAKTGAELREDAAGLAETVAQLKAEVGRLEGLIKEGDKAVNPFSAQLTTLQARAADLKAEGAEIAADLARVGARAERTKFWVKGFKEVRLYVIDEILSELELTTNAMLEEVGLVGWEVQYSVERETKSGTMSPGLNVTILGPGLKEPVRWESWSGGEGQRLRLVGALALSEVLLNHAGVETAMEILDEPTQHLSVEGVRDLTDFLATRAKQLDRQIWYVDHTSVESTRFSSVVTVIKDKRGARIEE